MAAEDTKALTINRAEIRKNGIPIAMVSGFTVNKTYRRGRVSQAKRSTAVELPVVGIDVSGSIQSYMMVDSDPVAEGLVPSTSGTKEQIITSLVSFAGDDLEVYDDETDTFACKVVGFAPSSVSLNLPEGAVGTVPISFQAIDCWFQSELGAIA